MKQHVTSLELSKRLKALGARQESVFWWRKYSLSKEANLYYIPDREDMDLLVLSGQKEYEYSAYLASELLSMVYENRKKDFWIYHNAGLYQLQSGQHDKTWEAPTFSEAVGEMYADLLENDLSKKA